MTLRSLTELWSLEGRAAVVTGAGRGLGLAIGRRLAEAGAFVAVNDVDPQAAESAVDGLLAAGRRAVSVPGDVSSSRDAVRIIEGAVDHFGRLDILINNAGLVPLKVFRDMPNDEWDRLFAVNVRGALLCADAASNVMIEQRTAGSIVNILSICAVRPMQPGLMAYSASKAALLMATQGLALSLAEHGIRVNGLMPTVMRTDSTKAIPDLRIPSIPLGRLVEPDEVARAAVFLASDMAEFVTGITLPVEGGRLLT